MLPDLIALFRKRGFTFVTLQDALKDPSVVKQVALSVLRHAVHNPKVSCCVSGPARVFKPTSMLSLFLVHKWPFTRLCQSYLFAPEGYWVGIQFTLLKLMELRACSRSPALSQCSC